MAGIHVSAPSTILGMDALAFILIIVVIFLVVGLIALSFLWILARKRLGAAFPRQGVGFFLHPSGFYDTKNISPGGKDTFETKGHKEIVHAHGNTTYKSKTGGPTIALIDPVSEFAQNARIIDYVMRMKDGIDFTLADGKKVKNKKFPSKDEAFLYYYEQMYLTRPNIGGPKGWVEEEKRKCKAAYGLIEKRKQESPSQIGSSAQEDWSNVPNPQAMQPSGQGQVTVQQQATQTQLPELESEYPDRVMSNPDFEAFMNNIAQCLINDNVKIFPQYFDGEVLTLNGIADWMHSPAPENTLKGEYDRGWTDRGEYDRKHGANDTMKYVLMFVMIVVAAGIAYSLFK